MLVFVASIVFLVSSFASSMTSWRQQQMMENMMSNVMRNMWPSKGKGKSRGKGTPKGQGKGQGDTDTGVTCRCCGKVGHHKQQCHHREKACNHCGKAGHIAAICTAKIGADATRKPAGNPLLPDATFVDVVQKNAVDPWFCHDCGFKVFDTKLAKCPSCQTKRPPGPKNTSYTSKAALKIIEDEDEPLVD